MVSPRIWSAAGVFLLLFSVSGWSADEVRFGREELEAFQILAKPEATSLRLDGHSGQFRPSPSLRYWKLENQDFEVDLNLGGKLVDLRFNELRARVPTVAFEANRIIIEISFHDQEKAIRSLLGAISLRGVALRAGVRFAQNGDIRLEYESGELIGELRGSGLLKPKWVVNAIRKAALKTLKSEIERALARPGLQETVAKGLMLWAQFSVDKNIQHVVPNTPRILADAIVYSVE